MTRRSRDESGVIAVVTAFMAVGLLVLAGLVADLGNARDVRLQAQSAADAAALAGANAVYAASAVPDLGAAVSAAKQFAHEDFNVADSAWATCTDAAPLPVPSGTPCISFDAAAPTRVRVVIPSRRLSLPLGSLAGVGSTNIGAVAEATVLPGGRAVCGLCVIGPGIHDIQNGNVAITGASAYFNGSVVANPQGSVVVSGSGSSISIQGSISNKGTFDPLPLLNQAPVTDPLAFLQLPPSYAALTRRTSACTGGPGIYTTLNLQSCTLQPGLYVVASGTQEHYSGPTAVNAPGVTLYFTCADATGMPRTCSPGEAGAGLLMTGQASLTITAPTSGATQGISIMADRNNTQTFGFRGNGGASSGTIYAASGTFDYRGNGTGAALDSLIVVNDLTFSGNNATLSSSYTQEKNAGLPPARPYLSR